MIIMQQGQVLCNFPVSVHEWAPSFGTHIFFIEMWGKASPVFDVMGWRAFNKYYFEENGI